MLRKILALILTVLVVAAMLASCKLFGGDDNSDNGGANPDSGNNGAQTGGTHTIFAPGESINIVKGKGAKDVTNVANLVYDLTGRIAGVLPSDSVSEGNEIILGFANRDICNKAQAKLDALVRKGAIEFEDEGRNVDRLGVFVIYAEGGSVAKTQGGSKRLALRKRKLTACRANAIASDDKRTVVQGRFIEEDITDQIGGGLRIDRNTRSDNVAELGGLFNDDKAARIALGKILRRLTDGGDGLHNKIRILLLAEVFQAAPGSVTNLFQHTADLGLEDHGQNAHVKDRAKQEGQGVHIHQGGHAPQKKQNANAERQIKGARIVQQMIKTENEKRDDDNVQNVRPFYKRKLAGNKAKPITEKINHTYFNQSF